ncbi:MAG: RNase III inhibitor [Alphaproteobacteria bacterium]|nr:MAG: RNase III inhibitor [Alphaproteobacteria bacterium]
MSNLIDPRLTMRVGNIVSQDVDVIVNSANSNLKLGSGVSGAIHTAAGPELEAHCVQFRPLALGQAILTPGFRLPQQIIHVRAPKYEEDPAPEHLLEQAVLNVLALAEQNGCRTVAIPALGTGVYRFPMESAANIIVRTVISNLRKSLALAEVRLVLASADALGTFEQIFRLNAHTASRRFNDR